MRGLHCIKIRAARGQLAHPGYGIGNSTPGLTVRAITALGRYLSSTLRRAGLWAPALLLFITLSLGADASARQRSDSGRIRAQLLELGVVVQSDARVSRHMSASN